MYSREEVKAITDKVLNMASKASDAEVDFSGGEPSATRFANSKRIPIHRSVDLNSNA